MNIFDICYDLIIRFLVALHEHHGDSSDRDQGASNNPESITRRSCRLGNYKISVNKLV